MKTMSATAPTLERDRTLDPRDVSKLAALAYALLRHSGDSQQWKRVISGLSSDLAKDVARALSGETPKSKEVEEIAKQIRHWARHTDRPQTP